MAVQTTPGGTGRGSGRQTTRARRGVVRKPQAASAIESVDAEPGRSLYLGRYRRSSLLDGRQIVVVLGMHRSGTSLLSNVLHLLGADMVQRSPRPDSKNPTGYWEREEINLLQDAILANIDRPIGKPSHVLPLPAGWWRDLRVKEAKTRLRDLVREQLDTILGPWGFKDPRTSRLLPMWAEIFDELGLQPRFVWALRHPADAGQSMALKNPKLRPMTAEQGEAMWLAYNYDIARYVLRHDPVIVSYEQWFVDPAATAMRLGEDLGLPWRGTKEELEETLAGLVDSDHRHHRSDEVTGRHPTLTQAFYEGLLEPDRAERLARINGLLPSVRATFAMIEPFASLADRVAPLLTEQQSLSEEAARLARSVQRKTNLLELRRSARRVQSAELEEVQWRLRKVHSRHQEAEADRAALQARLAERVQAENILREEQDRSSRAQEDVIAALALERDAAADIVRQLNSEVDQLRRQGEADHASTREVIEKISRDRDADAGQARAIRAELEAKLKNAEATAQSRAIALREAEETIGRLKVKRKADGEGLSHLQAELGRLQETNGLLREAIDGQTEALDKAGRVAFLKEAELEAAESKLGELELELKTLQLTYEEERRESVATIETMAQASASAKKQLLELGAEREASAAAYAVSQKALAGAETAVATLTAELGDVATKRDALEAALGDAMDSLEALRAERATRTAELSDSAARILELQGLLEASSAEIAAVTAERDGAIAEGIEVGRLLEAEKAESTRLLDTAAEAAQVAAQKEERIAGLVAAVDQAHRERQENDEAIAALREKHVRTEEEHARLISELSALSDEHSLLQAACDAAVLERETERAAILEIARRTGAAVGHWAVMRFEQSGAALSGLDGGEEHLSMMQARIARVAELLSAAELAASVFDWAAMTVSLEEALHEFDRVDSDANGAMELRNFHQEQAIGARVATEGALRVALDIADAKLATTVEDLKAEISAARDELAAQRAVMLIEKERADKLAERRGEAEEGLSAASEAIRIAYLETDRLNAEGKELINKAASLEEARRAASIEIESLRGEIAVLQSRTAERDDARNALVSVSAELEALREARMVAEERVRELQDALEQAERKREELCGALQEEMDVAAEAYVNRIHYLKEQLASRDLSAPATT